MYKPLYAARLVICTDIQIYVIYMYTGKTNVAQEMLQCSECFVQNCVSKSEAVVMVCRRLH